ncbi:MAG: magnesium transporter CorA family protein [Parcubacteria group bacterium]|nr:magnesium transporter CorA family protein [Parcubacteria group bacterium]
MPKPRPTITTFSNSAKDFTWISIERPDPSVRRLLIETHHFLPVDVDDILRGLQRSQINVRDRYLAMILWFPVYVKSERAIVGSEVDFFVSERSVITVHRGEIPAVKSFLARMGAKRERELLLSEGAGGLLYHLLDLLYRHCFPMLEHITKDVKAIERAIFDGREREMVEEISVVRRNISEFRRILKHQDTVLRTLKRVDPYYLAVGWDLYFAEIEETLEKIWSLLETHKENIEAYKDTNESLLTYRTNETMKVLTMVNVLMLPLTLVTALFSVSVTGIPFAQESYGFWIVAGVVLFLGAFLVLYSRLRRWW